MANTSISYRTYIGGQLFSLSYPDNWQQLGGGNSSIWLAPQGGYGEVQGRLVFTHGVNAGVSQMAGGNLRQATESFLNSLRQSNSKLRAQGGYLQGKIDNRDALGVKLSNVNEATGKQEEVTLYTTLLRNNSLFYMIAVAPAQEYSNFRDAFRNVLRSIKVKVPK